MNANSAEYKWVYCDLCTRARLGSAHKSYHIISKRSSGTALVQECPYQIIPRLVYARKRKEKSYIDAHVRVCANHYNNNIESRVGLVNGPLITLEGRALGWQVT